MLSVYLDVCNRQRPRKCLAQLWTQEYQPNTWCWQVSAMDPLSHGSSTSCAQMSQGSSLGLHTLGLEFSMLLHILEQGATVSTKSCASTSITICHLSSWNPFGYDGTTNSQYSAYYLLNHPSLRSQHFWAFCLWAYSQHPCHAPRHLKRFQSPDNCGKWHPAACGSHCRCDTRSCLNPWGIPELRGKRAPVRKKKMLYLGWAPPWQKYCHTVIPLCHRSAI